MAKIYTKTGDKGKTGLVGGSKVSKDDARIHAYGTVDETNSVLGFARTELKNIVSTFANQQNLRNFDRLVLLDQELERIQHLLFNLGGLLACEPSDREKYKLPHISAAQVHWLEERIDAATAILEPLKEFILPGGSELASRLHVVRTVSRRAERLMVHLSEDDVPEQGVPFMNRLSDYLFVMARLSNHCLGIKDVTWRK